MWRARRKRRWGRRLAAAVGVLAILVVALLLALPYVLRLDPLRDRIVQELSQGLGRPINAKALRVRFIPSFRLELEEVSLLDPPAFGGRPGLTAQTLSARLRLLPLLQRRLEVEGIELKGPVLTLRRGPGGGYNLFGSGPPRPPEEVPTGKREEPQKETPRAGPEPLPEPLPVSPLAGLLVAPLEVSDGEFRLEPRLGKDEAFTLKGVNFAFRPHGLSSPAEIHMRVREPNLHLTAEAGPFKDLWAFPLEGGLQIGGLSVEALRPLLAPTLRRSPLTPTGGELAGALRFTGNPSESLSLRGELFLTRFEASLLKRPFLQAGSEEVRLLPSVKLHLSGDPRLTAEVDLFAKAGQLKLKGEAEGVGRGSHWQWSLDGPNLDLAGVLPLLKASGGPSLAALEMAGFSSLKASFERSQRVSNFHLEWDARTSSVQFRDLFRKAPGVPASLVADGVRRGNQLEVMPWKLKLRQVELEGSLLADSLGSGPLHLRASSNKFPLEGLDELVPALKPYAPAGEARMTLAAQGRAEEILSRSHQAEVLLERAAFSLPGLPHRVRDLEGLILLSLHSLQLSGLKAVVGRSALEVEARLTDWDSPRLTFELRAPRLLLEDFLPPGGPPKKAFSPPLIQKASLSLFAESPQGEKGPLRGPSPLLTRMRAEGGLRVAEGSALGIAFQGLESTLRLAQGVLRAEGLKAKVYGGSLEGGGEMEVGAPRPAYRARFQLKDARAEALLAALGGPRVPVSGRLRLEGDLQGLGLSKDEMRNGLSGKGEVFLDEGELSGLGLLEELEALLQTPGLFSKEKGKLRLRSLQGPLRLEAGRLSTPGMELVGEEVTLQGKGHLTLDGTVDLELKALFSESASRRLTRGVLGALFRKGEQVVVPFRVRGPLDSLAVSLDPAFLKERLREDPSRVLGEVLKRLFR